MKKKSKHLIPIICTCLCAVLFLLAACGGEIETEGESESMKENESQTLLESESQTELENETIDPLDNHEGTLDLITSVDGKTVTVSYLVDGERVSYTVPNNTNYLSGGFAATDDLGRSLPSALTTGIYGENGEHYVGIFYFLWHGEHGDAGVYDLQKIMDKYGDLAKDATATDPETGKKIYGNVGDMHWFAEPLYGYYYAWDEWVIRKHVELLTNAGIDFLYFDVTNGYIYKQNAVMVMKVCHELNEQGYNAPKVVFYTNTQSASTMKQIYNGIYKSKLYPDTWLYVDGKPCIIGVEEGNVDGFFTVKSPQWPNEAQKENSWPWMDFSWPQRIFNDQNGNPSAISVSIAQHNRSITFSDSSLYGYAYNRGRSFNAIEETLATLEAYRKRFDADNTITNQGLNFQAQWDRAIEADVPFVLVTGWNEWVAQRQNGLALRGDEKFVYFVDTASMEFSRDAEMMRGGYFDNYYLQLISNIQRLKGSAPVIVQDARNHISLSGGFEQWDKVKITYTDPENDCKNRNCMGFGQTKYTDYSGNNDIVSAKITSDTKNLYFYVKTAKDISAYNNEDSWMQLFLNTDEDSQNGWYGYDFLVNSRVVNDKITEIAACSSDGGKLVTSKVGEVSYLVSGCEMMICVPLNLLGIDDYEKIYVEFKWADADRGTRFTTMEDFYCFGDVAPLGRLNWIYQNYIPKED